MQDGKSLIVEQHINFSVAHVRVAISVQAAALSGSETRWQFDIGFARYCETVTHVMQERNKKTENIQQNYRSKNKDSCSLHHLT